MDSTFLVEHSVEIMILLGISNIILFIISIRYQRKAYKQRVDGVVDESEQIQLYLTREAMMKGLKNMYKSANAGDIIWGQCVGCGAYSDDVREVVLKAASRGVKFKIILNTVAPTKDELRTVFAPLKTAKLKEAMDNNIRIQGLSDKEAIVAFPSANAYTAVRIREPNFLSIIKSYFDKHWAASSDSIHTRDT